MTKQKNMSPEEIVSSPEDLAKIKDAINEISHSMTKIEGEKELIKETIEMLNEEYGLAKSDVRKIAKVYFEQSYHQLKNDSEQLLSLYEAIIKPVSY